MDLNFVVFEEWVVESWLMRDVNTVNDIPIWTLFIKLNPGKSILYDHRTDKP